MPLDLNDYVAAGYFLSKHVGPQDCTGIELRRVTMSGEHSSRKFFPESWALSWCSATEREIDAALAAFGIPEDDLERVMDWADDNFDKTFGAFNVFFGLVEARFAANSVINHATGLDLWGLGLHRSYLKDYCEASGPPPTEPGFAPTGATGIHLMTCRRTQALAHGGEILGFEVLLDRYGLVSPESRHHDEQELFRALDITPNAHGLIDSFDQALRLCTYLDSHIAKEPNQILGWMPWLIVRYPLDG